MAIEDLRYIAVEGVIGAGKTSLTARLGQTLGAKAIYEEFGKGWHMGSGRYFRE